MVIDKIGSVGKIIKPERAGNVRSAQEGKGLGEDSVSISSEALKAKETAQAISLVAKAPDVRADRVKEVKEKLARGEYDSPDKEMLEKIARKIAQSLMGV